MDRKWEAAAAVAPPSSALNTSDGYATDGNPGGGVPATVPGAYMWHSIVEEMLACITAGGLALDKNTLTQLRDAIMQKVQTTTSTGTQNDFAVTASRRLVLRGNNATLLTFSGFAAGQDGDVIELVSVGAGEVDVTHQAGGSAAANRIITPTGATVKLLAGVGRALLVYDATTQRWRMRATDPGSTQIVLEGVSFPATQVASSDANTLDDYEEGTWTPIIGGATSESGQTYLIQNGEYVKIGKKVTVWFDTQFSAKGTITGNLTLKGLPFSNGLARTAIVAIFWNATVTAFVNASLSLLSGGSTAAINGLTAAATVPTAMTTADVGNSTELTATIEYKATT